MNTFSVLHSLTVPSAASISASSYPASVASRRASAEFRYGPVAFAAGGTLFGSFRRQLLVFSRNGSPPRYAGHSQDAITVVVGELRMSSPIAPYPRNAKCRT
ncbi:hypothetical protein GCM10025734_34130 [Kitasatospora paranensis]